MRPGRAPGVVVTDLGDQLVLLHAGTGRVFSLNETGRCIWRSVEGGLSAAVAALSERFDVEPERAREDVLSLANELFQAGLLVTTHHDPLD